MDKDKLPQELDVFISLLGEIDIIKNHLGMLDKNTHITLSHANVSAVLGNSECFRILKLIEMLNANVSAVNGALLGAAEIVTTNCTFDESAEKEDSDEETDPDDENRGEEKEEAPKEKKDNEVISNMLQYFKERFEGNDRK